MNEIPWFRAVKPVELLGVEFHPGVVWAAIAVAVVIVLYAIWVIAEDDDSARC